MKWKRFACTVLAAVSVLGGCAKAPDTASPSSKADGTGYTPPRGRFVETEITPPELKAPSGNVFDGAGVFAHPDGSLDYFAMIPDDKQEPPDAAWVHYRSPDGGDTWQQVDMSWAEELRQRYGVAGRPFGGELRMDDEKNIYCLTAERGSSAGEGPGRKSQHLFRIAPGGQIEEIPIVDFADPAFYDGMEVMATDAFERLPDGNFLLDFHWENRLLALYDGETGERAGELRDFDMLPGTNNLYRENSFVTPVFDPLRDELELATYDYGGKLLAAGPSLKGMYGEEMEFRLCAGEDGEIFLVNRKGVARAFSGGSYWEMLMDGTRYQFGRNDADIVHVGYDPVNSRFYMGLREIERGENGYPATRLYRYAFDKTAPAIPERTVTVFSLRESATLTQALTAFQIAYPDCRVEVKHPREGMPREEAARILETEFSQGKGPDVVLLDGLPIETLRATGALADLSELADPELYFGNLLAAFENGGKIDAIPARVVVPLMAGDRELLDTLRGLPDIVAAAKRTPLPPEQGDLEPLPEEEQPLISTIERFYAPAYVLYGLYAPYLDGPEGREKLLELLEGTKALWERYGGGIADGAAPPEKIVTAGFPMSAHYGGRTRLGIENCSGTSQFIFWSGYGYREEEGEPVYPSLLLESLFGAGVYYPSHIAAVNAFSENQERARDFVRVLLSCEVQTLDTGISADDPFGAFMEDGLPVNREAFSRGIGRDPWIVFATDPAELMESLDAPVLFDGRQRRRVLEELPAFYRGEETAGEAADKILAALQ